MAIIQTVIQGGGTTPTGTLQITTNGTHDVTNYATANVQVPTTAPAHYIEKSVDAGGVLQSGTTFIDLTGATSLNEYQLAYAYYDGILQGVETETFGSSISEVFLCVLQHVFSRF